MPKKTTRLRIHVKEELWGVYAAPSPRRTTSKKPAALYPRQQATWSAIAGLGFIPRGDGTEKLVGKVVAGRNIEDLVATILARFPTARVHQVDTGVGVYLEIIRKVTPTCA